MIRPRASCSTPGDYPGITAEIVAQLVEYAARMPDRIVIPSHDGRRGHPIVLPWEVAAQIHSLPAGAGRQCSGGASMANSVVELEVSSPRSSPILIRRPTFNNGNSDKTRDSDRERMRTVEIPDSRFQVPAFRGPRRIPAFACRVRLFALAKDRAGHSELEIELLYGIERCATCGPLSASVCRRWGRLLSTVMIAVDEEYASDDITDFAGLAAGRHSTRQWRGGGEARREPLSERRTVPKMIEITAEPIDHAAVTERVRSQLAGAVCTFLGTVREITGDRRTVALAYEAYPEMARKKMAELEEEARRRWPVIELALVHRVGDLDLGEVSVVVAVSCPHRQESFEACRWLIDTLKEVVPIWKKEIWADGNEEWVHPGLRPS